MSASDLQVTPLGGGRFLVEEDGRRRVAFGVAARGAAWVFLDGRVHVIDTAAPVRARGRASHDDAALASPMPATVMLIAAAPGQPVARGDVLIRLEAMKMELQITAPRDGVVRALHCRQGELVQPGVALLELE